MKTLCLLFLMCPIINGAAHTHTYNDGDPVMLWMNTVGPLHNRQETYAYFSLPFCSRTNASAGHFNETFLESLLGYDLALSGLNITYKNRISTQSLCAIELNEHYYKTLVYAVKNNYWYQMFIDDLPIWSIVGQIDGDNYYIWTHKKFDIGYNGDKIVDVNATAETKSRLTLGAKIPFTYEVNWKKSDINFDNRFDKYLDFNFFQEQMHWLSILISFVVLIILAILLYVLFKRILKGGHTPSRDRDNGRDKSKELSEDLEMSKDTLKHFKNEHGWKLVHSDVFRPIPHLPLFSALIGTGHQLIIITLAVILFNIFTKLYIDRSSYLSVTIFIYALTLPVNGFFGGSLYIRMGGRLWIKQMLLSALFYPALICGTVIFVNSMATYYHVSRAISFLTLLAIISVSTIIILLLTLVGTYMSRKFTGQQEIPSHVNTVPRSIPKKKWFVKPFIFILAGLLPFGSIFCEMYFILTSLWTHKIYFVYGYMLFVFLILIFVTICVTIICTYFMLNAEDYRWQWISFLSAGSTAIYVFLYSFYYFMFITKMYGLFQTTFYFGYMALFSLTIGIICGTVGYIGTNVFVKKIYGTLQTT